MDRYGANGTIAAVTATPGDTPLGVIASILTRAKIHFFALSVLGPPVADNVLQWLVRRFTAAGTSTGVTPTVLDTGAPGAQLAAGQGFTVEPTYSTTIFDWSVHQRSFCQWNAAPGSELVIPAVAANGIGFTPIHAAYNGPGAASAHWSE